MLVKMETGASGGGGSKCILALDKSGSNYDEKIIDSEYITRAGATITFNKACEGFITLGRNGTLVNTSTASYELKAEGGGYTSNVYSFSATSNQTLVFDISVTYADVLIFI